MKEASKVKLIIRKKKYLLGNSTTPQLFLLWLVYFLMFQYAQLNEVSYPNLAKTVFIIFMIFVPILLLNMLIAMMGRLKLICGQFW